ncbi:MAG: restriction endonuclease subunit S [Cyclobacteriaceae bacterium]
MEVVQEEIRPGYKMTKLGWFPEDWDISRLSALGIWKGGGTPSKANSSFWDNGTIPWASSRDIKGVILKNTTYLITENAIKESSANSIPAGNLLMVTRSGILQHTFPIAKNLFDVAINQDIKALILNKKFEVDFIQGVLIHRNGHILKTCSKVGTTVESIEYSWLKDYQIPVPKLPEQKAIAQVLSTWDKAIENLTQLIAEKQQKKKALMQQLLTGKKRFPGFDGEWKEVKLGDVFERIRETGEDIDDKSEAYTISSKLGFVTQHQKFDRVIAGSSLKKYTLIRRDEFSYNKGNSKTFPYGCIFKFEQDHGLIPFVYISFRSTGEVSIDFYKHYFFFGMLERQLKKIITSGARGDGLLNVNPDSFFKLMIDLPPVEEQQKIAEVLNAATKEIELLNQKLDALKDQKKGLMQQLLTGKKRLKI